MDFTYAWAPFSAWHCLIMSLELPADLGQKIDKSPASREQIAQFRTLNIDFFPRESHLILFQDPWSFPTLYHPACNQLVARHMYELSQKVWVKNRHHEYH